MWLSYAITLSGLILAVVGVWVYSVQKKDAYKFFFPAIVLFVLFSLVPISYSIYVSFTNLKTGHLLERKNIISLFEDERIIEKDSKFLSFKMFKGADDLYFLKVDNLLGRFKEKDAKVLLESSIELPLKTFKLTNGEVLELIEPRSDFKIIHPTMGEYSFYRTDILAETKPRYIKLGDSQFRDSLTNKNLVEDKEEGQFKLNGESVGPGYFTFIGLKNYKELFFDPATKFVFLKSLTWTLTWAALSVLLTFSLGAFLAVVLNEFSGRAKFIYRMVFIVPYSIPFFISVLVFKGMLNKDFGEINSWLDFLMISPIPWLENKIWAKVSVLIVNLWLGFPYMFLVITGIIQSIPKSIYEASSLEGASKFQNFRFLTLPLVLKAMIPLLIGSFAFNLNNFVGIYLLTGGGPVIPNVNAPIGETDILISYTYRLAFEGAQGQNFGMAAAVSIIIFIIVVVLTMLNFKVSKLVNK